MLKYAAIAEANHRDNLRRKQRKSKYGWSRDQTPHRGGKAYLVRIVSDILPKMRVNAFSSTGYIIEHISKYVCDVSR